ncbi:MAG: DUF6798 domain-containing protein, partial [Bacteriovoracaceae bacterium]
MLTKYRLQLVLLVILFGSLTFKVNNAFDSLPSARAFVSNWLNHDWYLSQFVPYRFLFNIPVGSLYKLTNFWFTFFSTKFVLFCAFTFVLARIYEKLNVSLLVLIISFTYFLNNQSLVAMEWIVGDSDAKPVAYILFFFALKDFISNKLSPKTFFLLGLSASFHVLVGGYLSITFFLALLFFKIIPKVKWILAFLLGSSIALYAVFYELGQESVHLADQIYIFTRLSHHLVPEWDVNRWLWKYVLFNGFLIWGYLKKDEVWKRFISLALITNIFWIMGLVVYYLGYHHLLKYYFFRVPDSLIPFTSYLVITSLLLEKVPSKFKEHKALIPLVFIIFSFRFSGQLFDFWDKQKSYPTKEIYSWIDQNVASDAVILANPSATNFFAHTNRSIYVSYKHLPQIKEFLIQYHRRLEFVLG